MSIVAHDRELVPYSSSVLGVDATWQDPSGAQSVEMLDGGYVDDITEPYDGLIRAPDESIDGTVVTVLTTVFLNRSVYLGYWHETKDSVPCNVHALVTLGLDEGEFDATLHSLH